MKSNRWEGEVYLAYSSRLSGKSKRNLKQVTSHPQQEQRGTNTSMLLLALIYLSLYSTVQGLSLGNSAAHNELDLPTRMNEKWRQSPTEIPTV